MCSGSRRGSMVSSTKECVSSRALRSSGRQSGEDDHSDAASRLQGAPDALKYVRKPGGGEDSWLNPRGRCTG